jgi:hypothetical protein
VHQGNYARTVEVSNLLNHYCQASGHRVNLVKSFIFFGKGCSNGTREIVKQTLQVPNESLNERYLGTPSDVGHSKNGTSNFLEDRIWSEIKGQFEKVLLLVGKKC